MVEVTVGEETFQKALRPYLLKYAYRNAERNDLLHSFSIMYGPDAASEDPFYAMNFTAADFMDTWTYQIGFPVIEVGL
ncbi:hypothetical protein AB6A40_010758 [Gnathostoma spinigerum]|uniref:Aminopeptidase N n=1 Tax=Gnathostoma spinigerum TaxID=75299 RepID=A0ABD6F264_9BILA